jgi:hypothetical protein
MFPCARVTSGDTRNEVVKVLFPVVAGWQRRPSCVSGNVLLLFRCTSSREGV